MIFESRENRLNLTKKTLGITRGNNLIHGKFGFMSKETNNRKDYKPSIE